jgi:hypothetical protein
MKWEMGNEKLVAGLTGLFLALSQLGNVITLETLNVLDGTLIC